jgi:outer membrane protein assembly factor BamB
MFADIKLKFYAIVVVLLSVFSLNGAAQYSLQWKYTTQGGIYSSPVVDGNAVFIGSNDSCVYSLDAQDGQLNWKFKTGGEVKSTPLVYKENLIFNSTDGCIYSINKHTARENWRMHTAGEKKHDMWDYYLSSPVLAKDKVIVGSGDGFIYA